MNTNELNRVLSDEIYKLRAGKVKADRVNAVTRAASAIIASARLQLAHMKMVGNSQSLPFFGANGNPPIEHKGKPKKLPKPKLPNGK